MDEWMRTRNGRQEKNRQQPSPLSNDCLTNAVESIGGPRSVGNRKPISWIPPAQCSGPPSGTLHFPSRKFFSSNRVPCIIALDHHPSSLHDGNSCWLTDIDMGASATGPQPQHFEKFPFILRVIDFADGNMNKKAGALRAGYEYERFELERMDERKQ